MNSPLPKTGVASGRNSILLWVLGLLALLTGASLRAQPAFLTNGLVAYYPLNGNTNDESGNVSAGSFWGQSLYGTDRFGNSNRSVGLNPGFRIKNGPKLGAPKTGYSFGLWFKGRATGSGGSLLTDRNPFNTDHTYSANLTLHNDGTIDNKIESGTGSSSGPWEVKSQAPISDPSEWQHVFCVVDLSTNENALNGTQYLFYNGQLIGSALFPKYLDYSSENTWYIGGLFELEALVDDVRIYDRALSGSEVKALYDYESTPPDGSFITNGLVAYYPFNNNAKDESGNGNNGLLQGGNPQFVNDFGDKKALALSADSWVSIPYSPAVNPKYSRTIIFWYKNDLPEPAGYILSCRSEFIGRNWNVGLNSESVALEEFAGYDSFVLVQTPFIGPQKWAQYVFVVDADIASEKQFKSYRNGLRAPVNRTYYNRSPLVKWENSQSETPVVVGRDTSNTENTINKGGVVCGFRMYNRALSDVEVKALYDYEKVYPPSDARIATATAQVVNGFVVGATVTDGGSGYTNTPAVTITGGGGTGATATATIANGSVTSITINNPGKGYTSTPTVTIAPPPYPPRKATGTSTVVNGFVVGAVVADGGFGYTQPPVVLLLGGGGTGATAVATVANGVVTGITITSPGSGYTSAPTVKVASPPFSPRLAIETSRVRILLDVVLGSKYLLEASTDMNTWTATGPAFVAEDEKLTQEFSVDLVGRYFRIRQVP